MDVHGVATDCVKPRVKADVAIAAGKVGVLGIGAGIINDNILPVAARSGKVLIKVHAVHYDISACRIGCREQTAVGAVVGGNADNQILVAGNVDVGFDQEAASAICSCGQFRCVCICIVLGSQTVKSDHAAQRICAVEQDLDGVKFRFRLRLRFGIWLRLSVGLGIGLRLGSALIGLRVLLLIKAHVCTCAVQRAEERNGIQIHHSAILGIQPGVKANICAIAAVQRICTVLHAILGIAVIEHDGDPLIRSRILDILIGINAAGYDIIVGAAACHKEHAVAASETGLDTDCHIRIIRNLGNCIIIDQEIGSATGDRGDLHGCLPVVILKHSTVHNLNVANRCAVKLDRILGIRLRVFGGLIILGSTAFARLDFNTAVCSCSSLGLKERDRIDVHHSVLVYRIPGVKANVGGIAGIHGISAILNAVTRIGVIQHDGLPLLGKGVDQRLIGVHAILDNIIARAFAGHEEHARALQIRGFDAYCYVRIFRNLGNTRISQNKVGSACCQHGHLHCLLLCVKGQIHHCHILRGNIANRGGIKGNDIIGILFKNTGVLGRTLIGRRALGGLMLFGGLLFGRCLGGAGFGGRILRFGLLRIACNHCKGQQQCKQRDPDTITFLHDLASFLIHNSICLSGRSYRPWQCPWASCTVGFPDHPQR